MIDLAMMNHLYRINMKICLEFTYGKGLSTEFPPPEELANWCYKYLTLPGPVYKLGGFSLCLGFVIQCGVENKPPELSCTTYTLYIIMCIIIVIS